MSFINLGGSDNNTDNNLKVFKKGNTLDLGHFKNTFKNEIDNVIDLAKFDDSVVDCGAITEKVQN